MLSAIIGLAGVLVGVISSQLGQWIAYRREKAQWQRNQEAEQQKWLREKLLEIYSNCIYYVDDPVALPSYRVTEERELEYTKIGIEYYIYTLAHWKEKRRWLNLLKVYHPFKGTEDQQTFLDKLSKNKLTIDDINTLAAADPRIHDRANSIV